MKINDNLSKTFDLLRFPLAVLVVILHIQPTIRITDFDNLSFTDSSQRFYCIINMIGTKISLCAVPTFFCISGYLLAFNIKKLTLKTYFQKIKNRIKTLFIPFVIWNLLAVAYLWGTGQTNVDNLTLKYIFLSPINFPLWFLRDLITMVMFFPIFYWIVKWFDTPGFILITIFFLLSSLVPFQGIYYLYLSSMFFFYAGMFAAYKKVHLDNLSSSFKILTVIAFLTLLVTSLVVRGYYAYFVANLYLIMAVSTVFVIAHWCVSHLKITAVGLLSSASFFIYCSHKLGPTFISKLGFQSLGAGSDIVIFLFSPLLTVAICLVLYYILQKFCSPLLQFLTGRKSNS